MAKKSEEQQEDVKNVAEFVAVTAPGSPDPVTQVENGSPKPLHELAVLHRVSGWQQAALARLMGWQEGKVVTDADYRAALDRLNARRLGSGRKE